MKIKKHITHIFLHNFSLQKNEVLYNLNFNTMELTRQAEFQVDSAAEVLRSMFFNHKSVSFCSHFSSFNHKMDTDKTYKEIQIRASNFFIIWEKTISIQNMLLKGIQARYIGRDVEKTGYEAKKCQLKTTYIIYLCIHDALI